MRRRVTAATNKVEAYNGFFEWLHFGNRGVIAVHADGALGISESCGSDPSRVGCDQAVLYTRCHG
jgi:hypothetical protein